MLENSIGVKKLGTKIPPCPLTTGLQTMSRNLHNTPEFLVDTKNITKQLTTPQHQTLSLKYQLLMQYDNLNIYTHQKNYQ